MIVTAASNEESDRQSAILASAILSSVSEGADLDGIISDATVWSETCGTAFYKVIWDGNAGAAVGADTNGRRLRQGEANISVVSPFEIYPYSLSVENVDEQPSIIHAKAVPVQDIYSAYGVKLEGRDIEDMSGVRHGCELVIERYERPFEGAPNGRLTVVAGGALLYDGALPYINCDGGERGYPFIKQISMPARGAFSAGAW